MSCCWPPSSPFWRAFCWRLFLATRLGLSIRATGDNRDMVRASSVNPTFTITVGLCIANALTALSGAIVGQYQKTVDINSGTGIVVIGLACLIIGETVLGRRTVTKGIIAVVIGLHHLPLYLRHRVLYQGGAGGLPEAAHRRHRGAGHRRAQHQKVGRLPEAEDGRGPEGGQLICWTSEIFPRPLTPAPSTRKRPSTGLSLHLDPGDFVTIIGSNGAGKSTLFNAIAGSFYVDEGSIVVDGRDITFMPEYRRAKHIGRLFQDPLKGTAPNMTIEENLALAARAAAAGSPP